MTVIQAVCNILFRCVRARHGFRLVKIDATHIQIHGNRLRSGHHFQVLDGFVGVEGVAHFGPTAFAVVWRFPISHVVGVLGLAVVKHGIVRPHGAGRHVGHAVRHATGFNGIVFVEDGIRGCIGECARGQSEPFSPVIFIFGTHVQPRKHEHNC